MKRDHAQLVEDYNKLISMYGVPYDLGAGMVVETHLMKAVEIGTQKACYEAILEIINYGFQWASENTVYRYQDGDKYKEISVYECDFIRYIFIIYIA